MQKSCPQCGVSFQPTSSAVNRAAKVGAPMYCGKACAGLARRKPVTAAAKRQAKAEYDRKRRELLADKIKAKKRESYYANHDSHLAKQAERRKDPDNKAKHAAYIAKPEYRAKKKIYDDQSRNDEYGNFAESWRLLLELEKELREQASAYERRKARGYYTRQSINRRRDLWKLKTNSMQAI